MASAFSTCCLVAVGFGVGFNRLEATDDENVQQLLKRHLTGVLLVDGIVRLLNAAKQILRNLERVVGVGRRRHGA